MSRLVIFGAGQIGQVAHYYFTEDSGYDVVAFTMDADFIEADTVLPVPQGMEPTHVEVGLSRYRRAFTLSKELDADKVSAEMSHGVLRVRIPKAEHAQPRRIAVQVA